MRKSRSAHTKCDCGEKTHKCAHLKATIEGHRDSCCCNHGGRCTCAFKKEIHLDTVRESDSDKDNATNAKSAKGGIRNRRRANTIHSGGMLSFDENGHRKPTFKHAKASQKCGPYQLNRVSSLHGLHSASPSESRSSKSPISISSTPDRRKSKSEAASPLMTGSSSFAQLNGQLPPLDLSAIEYPTWTPNSYDYAGNLSDHEQPMFSAGLSATSVDWSHYDGLDFANKAVEFAPSSYSQPQSFGGFEFNGCEQPPTLTTNTSTAGEASELDDLPSHNFEDFEKNGSFRTSANSSGFNISQMHTNMLGRTDLTTISYDEFKLMKAGTKFLPTPASLAGDEAILAPTSAGTMGNFSLEVEDTAAALWMGDYHGLPGMPAMTESPDSSMPSFWDAQ